MFYLCFDFEYHSSSQIKDLVSGAERWMQYRVKINKIIKPYTKHNL